jgi:acyl-homoserine lactone synthase
MNLLILPGTHLTSHPTLRTLIFRHRHKVFVEKLGWEAIRRADGFETDAFDTKHAVHFIVLSPSGKIAAYACLLPTTQPHLLSNVYPELLGPAAKLPVGEEVWEWTRCTAVPIPTKHGFTLSPAGRMLILGIVEWALEHSVTTLSLQCDPSFTSVIEHLGARAELLAEPSKTTEGQSVVPMLMHMNHKSVETTKVVFGRMQKEEEEEEGCKSPR